MLTPVSFFQKVAVVGILLVAVLGPPIAEARPVSHWTPKHLIREADILVTGEVLEVIEQESISKEATRWEIPLHRMNAKILTRRAFHLSREMGTRDGDVLHLSYYEIDWENCGGTINGPRFPALSVGDAFVFPLRAAKRQTEDSWELIDEEDFGLLTPAVIERPRLDSEARTGLAFLRSELAGAFSRGKYRTVFKAAKYLSHSADWNTHFEETYKLIAQQVADDQARWLKIAVACYSAMGMPRPRIADLPRRRRGPPNVLAARALGHIDTEDLDARFIALSIEQAEVHAWGTAVTMSINYSHHPTAIRLLKKALEDATPGAVFVAGYTIKDEGHPLCAVAVDAAVRVLKEPDTPDFSRFRAACKLIRDYGDEEAFGFLLEDIRKSQKTDRERYKKLWQSCAYVQNQRLIPICQIVIEDRTAFSDERRFCDVAAFQLQRVTGEDFGLSPKQTASEREKAIQRARQYLDQ